jgi:hypothetical protein
MQRHSPVDLTVNKLSESSRGQDLCDDVRDLLDDYENYVLDAITWYMADKKAKSVLARSLRATAIILVAIGALLPLVEAELGNIAGYWGYILLGGAAACVGFDHLFGLSAAWTRDVVTALRLQRCLQDFQLAWVRLNTASGSGEELRLARIDVLFTLRVAVADSIESETRDWVREFRRTSPLMDLQVISDFRPRLQ